MIRRATTTRESHGYVTPRGDGTAQGCGGPACCEVCFLEWREVRKDYSNSRSVKYIRTVQQQVRDADAT